MCRLFAYLRSDHPVETETPSDRTKILGSLLHDFIDLARVGKVLPGKSEGHLDGWGLAYLSGNGINGLDSWTLRKSASSALDPDHGLRSAVEEALQNNSPQIVAHIRKASLGSINVENSHPFLWHDKVFSHNGTVFKPEKFGDIEGLEGTTDSEKLFRYVMRELGINGDSSVVDNAKYLQILKAVKRIAGYTSLTSILAEPRRLLVYRDYNHKNSELRAKVLGDYYTLYFASAPEGLFVCSEPIGDPAYGLDWQEIKDKHMLFALADERLKVGVLS